MGFCIGIRLGAFILGIGAPIIKVLCGGFHSSDIAIAPKP